MVRDDQKKFKLFGEFYCLTFFSLMWTEIILKIKVNIMDVCKNYL